MSAKDIKIAAHDVTLSEWPGEITLYIEISGCPNHCPGCHSAYLVNDIGEILSDELLVHLMHRNTGITAIVIGGGDQNPARVNELAKVAKKENPDIKVCWYSGAKEISTIIDLNDFDAIKIGPYVEKLGGLTSKTTNQKFYLVEKSNIPNESYRLKDVTRELFDTKYITL